MKEQEPPLRGHRDKRKRSIRRKWSKTSTQPYVTLRDRGKHECARRIILFDILEITGQMCPANCQLVKWEGVRGKTDGERASERRLEGGERL